MGKRKRLRIAQLAPMIERVPPKKYGGTERVVFALVEELVKRGHDVTLFASGDSLTSAHLYSVHPRALREARIKDLYGHNGISLLNIGNAYEMQDQFDIIHDHCAPISILPAHFSKTPVVMTLHGIPGLSSKRLFEAFTNPYFVSISKAQALSVPKVPVIETVHNGLNMAHYPFGAKQKGYLLVVGRISLDKGTHYAIDVATALDLPLIIAAKVDRQDKEYFRDFVEPRLSDDRIKWIGEVSESERNKLMAGAMCLLHPVTWKEPFGLVMIEAMACGAPVVAFNKGSIPEIVKNGVTGFVVNDAEEMIDAIEEVGNIDRAKCREYVLENFNASVMADGYEKVYEEILSEKIRLPHVNKFYPHQSH